MIDEKKLIKDILQHEDALKDANYVYKNGYETRGKEIIDIIERQPTIEAVPMVHLDVKKSEILDTLDKMQFFLGQRAGRELWNDKPEDIQEKDLENFNRDIQKIKEYLFNVKPVKRGEWLGDKWWRECSECGNVVSSSKTTKFCIECGADMRKKV